MRKETKNKARKNKIPTIWEGQIVKSYRYGDTLEMTTSNGNHEKKIMVLPNRKYMILDTGEVKDMDTSAENRQDNLRSVKMTMRKLRRLVAHNFRGGKKELWLTLTYRDHIIDPIVAYRDFKVFIKRLRKKYGCLEYIAVIEPQASGRWHYHILLKTLDDRTLNIPNKKMEELWGHGFTTTKRLKCSDKIGNYVLAYVSNLELPQSDNNTEKKYIKGARLYLYPKGIRIYRCSKGIDKPIEETGCKENIMRKNGIDISAVSNFSRKTVHETPFGQKITYITEYFSDIDK